MQNGVSKSQAKPIMSSFYVSMLSFRVKEGMQENLLSKFHLVDEKQLEGRSHAYFFDDVLFR